MVKKLPEGTVKGEIERKKKTPKEKEDVDPNAEVKKGFLIAGIKVIETILKGILHKQQGKDPLEEAVKECEDTISDVIKTRKDKRQN